MGKGIEGSLALLLGAFLFASSNVVAKAAYNRHISQTALFIVRGLFVYLLNASLETVRSGPAAARQVLLLRAGSLRRVQLTMLRSSAGFLGIFLLNVAFQMMHLADAFAVVLGTMTLSTVLLARVCIGGAAEQLSLRAVGGGSVAAVGIVFVTQPTALFAGEAPPPAGVALAMLAGSVLGVFNVLSRILGRAGTQRVSPAMLLSYYMVFVGIGSAAIVAVFAVAAGKMTTPAWAEFVLPVDDAVCWGLVTLCAALACRTFT